MIEPMRLTESERASPEGALGELIRDSLAEEGALISSPPCTALIAPARLETMPRARRHSGAPRRALLPAGTAIALLAIALAAFGLFRSAERSGSGDWEQEGASEKHSANPLLAIEGLGLFEREPESPFQLEEGAHERRLELASGSLRAQVYPQSMGRPLVVVTPHLRVVVLGTRFDLLVTTSKTTVTLIQGSVRVETAHGSVLLGTGESIDSDEPMLVPPRMPTPREARTFSERLTKRLPAATHRGNRALRTAPPVAAPSVDALGCDDQVDQQQSIACLAHLSRGDGLAAQSALYLLGQKLGGEHAGRTEARRLFAELRERFPDSIYVPEATLRLFELFRSDGSREEAIAAADFFERQFPGDPRVPELQLSRAQLLCERPGGRTEALLLMEELQSSSDPRLRSEVLEALGRCQVPARLPRTRH